MTSQSSSQDQLSALLQLLTESGSIAESSNQQMAKYLIDMAIIEIAQQLPRLDCKYDQYCNSIFETYDEISKN